MADEPIPLFDGEPSGAKIVPEEEQGRGGTQTVRSKRKGPRRPCDRVHVCFSPMLASGLIENVECPVHDLSARGMALEFDGRLDVGVTGYVSFRTISHQPVRVSCRVRRCRRLENGYYLLGLGFDRLLKFEERRPARVGPGRELAPGLRARKLRDPKASGTARG